MTSRMDPTRRVLWKETLMNRVSLDSMVLIVYEHKILGTPPRYSLSDGAHLNVLEGSIFSDA